MRHGEAVHRIAVLDVLHLGVADGLKTVDQGLAHHVDFIVVEGDGDIGP